MSSRPRIRSSFAALGLVTGLLAGAFVAPAMAHADGVDDAQADVDQTLADLEQMRNQMGQLDEDYGAAQDRKVELDQEIAVAQAQVSDMETQLGGVETLLQDMAVARFTSGGNSSLSPIFADAATYSAAEQKEALNTFALDAGEINVDDLESLLDDLYDARDSLAGKLDEQAQLIATLEDKQQQFAELEQVYLEKYEQAKVDLGEAKLQKAEDDAAAAAAAAAARAAAQQPSTGGNTGGGTTSPGRGGGGTTTGGGSTGGSTGGSGGSTGGSGGGSPPAPPVSGKAGIAVQAAYGQLGVPYRFAAESPGVAFDCSGLTKYAWGRAGVYLPHQSRAQYAAVPHVTRDQIQPGDLVFYYSPIGHVGIYIGNGLLIHAPNTGDVVKISAVSWSKVVGIGRPG